MNESWHDVSMARGKDHDFFTVARRVVEQAIGEQMDGTPLVDDNSGKNPSAIARGRKGGKIGGAARAKRLTSEERSAIAKKAARARWQS
ncbi:MAG: histone H1 [Acidobacteriota bacterium]|nr:histone H1 [Acidobacteriota bacterium]